ALTSQGYSIIAGNLLNNHQIMPAMMSSITLPGSVDNTIGITIVDEFNQQLTNIYDVTYILGELTVLPIELVISSSTASKPYDGQPLSDLNWTLISGILLPNHQVIVVMSASITEPGSTNNTIGATVVDNQNNDVGHYYEITYQIGTLTVHPRALVISTNDDSKMYDGLPLTNSNWTLMSGALFDNHQIIPVMVSTITNPGSIANNIGVTIIDEFNNDVTWMYDISIDLGHLTVEPIPIILQSGSANKVYDGLPLSDNTWTLIHGTPLSGHNLNVVVTGEITDVGTISNMIFAFMLDDLGNNVSRFYDFEYYEGDLTVLTSVYGTGDISTDPVDPSTEEVLNIYSTVNESIYLRDVSYGDYTGRGWTQGVNHNLNVDTNPLSFASLALQAQGSTSLTFRVEYLRGQTPFLLPYYTNDTLPNVNDIHIYGDTTEIVDYHRYTYLYNPAVSVVNTDPNVISQEQAYRMYVYNQFLTLPETTRQAMLQIASDQGINPLSSTLIDDVKNYIQSAATYNLDFDPIPNTVTDIGVYFLTESKEGICQHFATAAVLMYRALNVPARYVTGYLGMAKANTWVTVTGDYAHAWVEVYIDGFGWMPVEVTGGGPGESGGGPGDSSEPEVPLIKITVTPSTVREVYVPGKTIVPTNALISGFSIYQSLGYTYDIDFSGSLSEIGTAISSVNNITIYNDLGEDVTNLFEIETRNGLLQLYSNQINLYTTGGTKVYDGTALINHTWHYTGTLAPGHSIVEVNFTGEQTNVGTSKNKALLKIIDGDGLDVTTQYYVVNYYGNLTVTPRAISIESSSATKSFDGTPLTSSIYAITAGSLANTHTIEVVIGGAQVSIGSSVNTIESITILYNGADVTNNYTIEISEGQLTITPPL
ncbi:MAG: transglutaminase domain-containing protein, partial [Acholeplasma sp.]|nr:transglutaminase domain-containing protein [Acholeplasma sp.]